jgi:hypothetical protein
VHAKLLQKTSGDWLFSNEHNFSIVGYHSSQRLIDLIKPLGEMVLACSLISRFAENSYSPQANSFITTAWGELAEGELLREIVAIRPDLLVMAGVYSDFSEHGLQNTKLHAEILKIAKTPGFYLQDWPAWRRLDLLVGLKSLGVNVVDEIEATYKRTWLAGCHSPWTLTEGSAYGVTHTIFYMTDYGANPNGCGDRVTEYLNDALPKWLRYYIDEANYDLAAEMLMSLSCIGQSDGLDEYFEVIASNKLSDGAIPGPEFGSATLLHGETISSRRHFLHHYHTTLVSFMAAAMHLTISTSNKARCNGS